MTSPPNIKLSVTARLWLIAVSTQYTNVTDRHPAIQPDTARQQESHYATSLGCSRAAKRQTDGPTPDAASVTVQVTVNILSGAVSDPEKKWKPGWPRHTLFRLKTVITRLQKQWPVRVEGATRSCAKRDHRGGKLHHRQNSQNVSSEGQKVV